MKHRIEEAVRADAAREAEPVTKGLLAGETMSILWATWPPDAERRTPVDLAVEWTPDPKGRTYTLEGRVLVDPIEVARAAQDPKRWNQTLVESAQLLVRDAIVRGRVNAKGGAPC